METQFGDIKIKGAKFAVTISAEGKFYTITPDGTPIEGASLDELKRRCAQYVGSKPLNIRFCIFNQNYNKDNQIERGTILNKHQNGNLIVKWDGESVTAKYARYHEMLIDLNEAQAKKLKKLAAAIEKAQDTFDAYKATLHLTI